MLLLGLHFSLPHDLCARPQCPLESGEGVPLRLFLVTKPGKNPMATTEVVIFFLILRWFANVYNGLAEELTESSGYKTVT